MTSPEHAGAIDDWTTEKDVIHVDDCVLHKTQSIGRWTVKTLSGTDLGWVIHLGPSDSDPWDAYAVQRAHDFGAKVGHRVATLDAAVQAVASADLN